MTLPTPRTDTDALLAAVHTELVGLRADMAAARGGERPHPNVPDDSGRVLIQEPEPSPAAPPSPGAGDTKRTRTRSRK